jgi:DNA-binding GntR family transcriptional regulator
MDAIDQLSVLAPPTRERRTTSAYVAESLRAAIRGSVLADGTELNQVALAEHFGVSRVPIREALSALEAEGWITLRAHHRAVVEALSPGKIEQIFEVRTLLETHLVAKAIKNIDAGRLRELYALCDAMDKMRDHDKWVECNRRFHRDLLASSESDMILGLLERTTAQVERYLRLRRAGPMREKSAGAEHRAILDVVSKRDVRQAKSLLQSHIESTKNLVLAAVRKSRESSKPTTLKAKK